jgi:hypothetical protein
MGPKLHRAQTGARLRGASGTYVPAVAFRATGIPPTQALGRGFAAVSFCLKGIARSADSYLKAAQSAAIPIKQ